MTLPTRKLGGIESSALGFGCMSLTPGFYGDDVDQVETEKTLRRALDLGVTLLNTADFYSSMTSGKTSENIKLIGKVLKDYSREKIKIVMKWGPWIEGGRAPHDNSPAGCKERIDKALQNLGTEYIDVLVYRFVTPDRHNTPIEDIARGMKEVLEAGKVRAIGVSEVSLDQFKAIQSIVPVSLVELEWSLFSRDSEKDIIPYARSIGAGILAYSPIGKGVLTGKYDPSKIEAGDMRSNLNPRFLPEALDNNQKLAKLVANLAEKKGCTPGQLAIAYVLAQGDDVVPIPGTKRIPYLEENLKSLEVKLTKAEIDELHTIVPQDKVAGARY